MEYSNVDTLAQYFKEISSHSLLTRERERELAIQVAKGDEIAKQELIKSNLKLVVSIAKKYLGLGLPLQDLVQEGNIGLIKGIEKYDVNTGFRLSTYVTFWIKQSITRAINNCKDTIRLPIHQREKLMKYNKQSKLLTMKLGRKPSKKELANHLGIDIKELEYLDYLNSEICSLDKPSPEDETTSMFDIVQDKNAVSP